MKKLLIITYYWPPSAGSGVQRWLKMSKYLPEMGWQPVIYTPENPDFGVLDDSLLKDIPKEAIVIKSKIWEPYHIANLLFSSKKANTGHTSKSSFSNILMNFIRGNFFIPDPRKYWVKPSIKKLSKIMGELKIDHVVTTGPPHSMHLIGLGLKKKFPDIKWIADFRDPWAQMDILDEFHLLKWSRNKFRSLESEVLNNCDIVSSTSYSMHELLEPFDLSKFKVITNGFDEDDFKQVDFTKSTNKILIYHAGLMNDYRFPKTLFDAFENLLHHGFNLNVQLVGNISDSIKQKINNYKLLSKSCLFEGYKSHKEVLNDYVEASHLLLLVNNSKVSKACIPGKLFEYLVSKKNIIAIGKPDDDALTILKDLGHFTSNYSEPINVEILKSFLLKKRPTHSVESFSRKNLCRKYVDEVLDPLC